MFLLADGKPVLLMSRLYIAHQEGVNLMPPYQAVSAITKKERYSLPLFLDVLAPLLCENISER